MGTKNKPGQYDCYSQAEPDEPMFVLLARDPMAPILVELWASLREERITNTLKGDEARICAQDMRVWREKRQKLLASV
jgi:hypothetical protein